MKKLKKFYFHPQSRIGKIVKAYGMVGFEIDTVVENIEGRNTAYLTGRGVRVYINANGLTKFVSRFDTKAA